MALGNSNNHDSKYTLIILRPSFPKEGDGKPSFTVIKKEDGAYVECGNVDKFTGTLTKLQLGDLYDTSTEKGKALAEKYGNSKAVSLTFVDEATAEQYLVRFSFRLYTRAFFNSLLNVESVDNLQVALWQDAKTKHNRISLRQGDNLVKWKYSMDDVPRPEETKNSRGVVVDVDYSNVDNFFYEKLEEFANKVFSKQDSGPKETEKPKAVKQEKVATKKPVSTEESEDDIPF